MRKLVLAAVSIAALTGLAACQNPAEKEADARYDAVEAQADVTATQLENQADAAPTEAVACPACGDLSLQHRGGGWICDTCGAAPQMQG